MTTTNKWFVAFVQILVFWMLPENCAHARATSVVSTNNAGGGFNYEIEKRVHERVSELMNVPVRMLGLVEMFAQTDVFEPPVLRPHQKDEFFRFLWTVWSEFNVDLYYGQEDGLFLGIIKGSGTYQEGRGTNGYLLDESQASDEDLYMKRLYYKECLNRETGATENCTLSEGEDYVECVNNCRPVPCPSSESDKFQAREVDSNGIEVRIASTNKTMTYCPAYSIKKVPASLNGQTAMGYVPRYYYCLNNAGKFVENYPPNTVASPDSMMDGVCTHSDGKTLVDGKLSEGRTYAMANKKNYVFLRDYDSNSTDKTAAALYSVDPDSIPNNQKSDQVFVGGYHSRRYEPRLRPWYIGTRDIHNAFWTSPYPFATANDIGISYGKPLYYTDPNTGHKVFRGVICVDYDLNEISKFLNDVFRDILTDEQHDNANRYSSSSGATVLIVEDAEPNYIIGSSTGSSSTKKIRVDDESIDCDDSDIFAGIECKTVRSTAEDYAKNSRNNPKDGIMARAFQAQKEKEHPKTLVVSPSGDNSNENGLADYYVSQSLIYEQTEGQNLKWRIIVAMPVATATNDELNWGDPVTAVVFSVGLIGCISCIALFYIYFSKRGKREVAMSDWRFTSAFILGCALLNLSTLTTIGPTTDMSCMLRMWSFHLVFVLALTPLLVKVWRIHKLVGSAARAVRLSITNKKAVLYTLPVIAVQVLILTLFSILDPSVPYTSVEIDGSSSYQHIVCKHSTNGFTITQLIFEGGFIFVGCVLAFLTRNLGEALGEAKQLLFAMYNIALVALIVLLLGAFLSIDQKSVYVIMTVGVFWATVFSSCAFVLPRLMQVQNDSRRRISQRTSRSFARHNSYNNSSVELGNDRGSFRSGPMSANETVKNMYLAATSLTNEPRSTMQPPSLSSGEFRWNSKTTDDMGSVREELVSEGSQSRERKKRNTSFTTKSISPSEAREIANDISSKDEVELESSKSDSDANDVEAGIIKS